MVYVKDALSDGTMLPLCADCVCNYCKERQCTHCPKDPDDSSCCKCTCDK